MAGYVHMRQIPYSDIHVPLIRSSQFYIALRFNRTALALSLLSLFYLPLRFHMLFLLSLSSGFNLACLPGIDFTCSVFYAYNIRQNKQETRTKGSSEHMKR